MFPSRDLHFVEIFQCVLFDVNGSNSHDFAKVDVLGNKRFNNNYAGWPRSDLALIDAQTDLKVAKAMALELEQFDSPNVNDGLTDQEILLQAKSKYCQSPSEQMRYYERMLEIRDKRAADIATYKARVAAARAAAQAEQELKDSLTPEEREEVRTAKRKNQINKLVK